VCSSFVIFVYSCVFCSNLTTCVCVCHSLHGLLWVCLRARRFRATLLLHTVCAVISVCRVCTPDVLGALAVRRPNIKKKVPSERKKNSRAPGREAKEGFSGFITTNKKRRRAVLETADNLFTAHHLYSFLL